MSQSPERNEDEGPAIQTPDNNNDTAQPSNDTIGEEMNNPTRPEELGYDFEVKEQDRWLPIANVARIMKLALPENAKIAKEAKECMQECVSEFISFITSEASEKCQQEKRKTVNGEDILFAMTSLGFENYGEALKIYLARYRENLVAKGGDKTSGAVAATHDPSAPYDSNGLGGSLEGGDSSTDFAYGTTAGQY
ncbi:Putative transcription factor, NFYB/HAP3, transcription factor CBF/NF-Y/archaeal histone [Septoria linicola]|uniref:Transcription factor, NFYB/HAP3, transcription factor CBF/NF-Y/archaeal histone n=1 Tax=Septoria linicola TaxID=215465 RepID=A0A9Q9EMK0_9PEZI|nr:putative transcription factor, NFYB/HAP3, transcription factor CBF/NF-Y/archaeal histone [Septoria linicola]USW54528.1 Putative transcription factor, NFYB/HAP3, transcription factor CBF/NF-Y/archaeal histone [Septoria linicola]